LVHQVSTIWIRSQEAIMITRIIQSFIQEQHAWDCYIDIMANLPDNF
jgi:hypothetical protein